MSYSQDFAETVALQCLGWIAGHEELLPVFLGSTGAAEADLRAGAQDPDFLGSVLDFLLMDDAWVVEFCAAHGMSNDAPMQARAALPGGAEMNWT